MSKLLRADFVRMFKSKIFWAGVLFMAGLAGLIVFTRWNAMRTVPGYYCFADEIFLVGAMYISIVIAIFVGIFIGEDYSSGTIRNKHIMGHSRMSMYLSNLITCSIASVIMHIAFIVVIIGSSVFGIIGKSKMSAEKIAGMCLITVFSVLSITAIILFISMLIPKKSTGVVTAMIFSILLIFIANTIDYRLSAKEYIQPYTFTVTNEDGTEQEIEQPLTKNPKYLTGTKKKVFQFFHDTLPVDQIVQVYYQKNDNDKNFPINSICVIAIVTGAGIFIFRRKDLK